jgi:biotin operon repressor
MARADWSGQELADQLGVTTRTIRNDVERLRDLGYPVHASPGVGGGYRLGAGAALPPLLLDDEEAVAVAVGLRTAAGGSVTGIQETSIRALAKLDQVLPSRLRNRVKALQAATVEIPAPGPAVDPEVLTAIAGACRDHQRLRFDYRDHDRSATWRYRARVRVHAPAAMVTGRLPPAVVVEAVDEHTCVIDVGSDTPQMLALYLGMLDVDFDVDDPELVEQLRTLADRYRRAITTTGPCSSR